MKSHYTLPSLTLLFLGSIVSAFAAPEKVGYNTHVRPILSDKCFLCHGPDTANNKADLRLDIPEAAYATLKDSTAHAIVPGDLEKSEIWKRIISDDPKFIMPTPETNLVMTDSEKEIIKQWILQGAEYEPHWSYVPLREEISVPKVAEASWPKNPIDHFVAAKLEKEKLKPSSETDPAIWLRRVSLDLTGLPPTLEQIEAFKKDLKANGETAYGKVVDGLLASPEYGEQMAHEWLDAARYADTFGYHADMTFTPWPYRDWVVKAFNNDLPYDQFVTYNVAGDLMPNATRDQKLATAFNRLHRITNEGGSNALEFFVDGVSDRVNTFGTAFMGLTMECSKCHDHKYDPITAKDYFQIFAFFNSIEESGLYGHSNISPPPGLLLPNAQQEQQLEKHESTLANLESKLQQMEQDAGPAFEAWKASLNTESKWIISDQNGHFDFEKSADDPLKSRIQPAQPRKDKKPLALSLKEPNFVEGPKGRGTAVELNGDNGAHAEDFFLLDRYTPFTLGLWLNDTKRSEQSSIIAQRCKGTEVGYNGVDLRIENGYLIAKVFRAWPGNGIGVKTLKQYPQSEWHHLTLSYDGRSKAAGLKLYLDGELMETEVIGDKLYKSVSTKTYRPGHFMLGEIFRGRGVKGGQIDDVMTFDRALTPLEIHHISEKALLTESVTSAAEGQLLDYFLNNHHEPYRKTLADLQQVYTDIAKTEDKILEVPVMEESDEPRPAYVLARGNFDSPRTKKNQVERDSLSFLLPFPKDAPRDRLGLAQWLTLPNHPLTSRVYVNRVWQQLFGRGIVGTTENFGLQGDLPTHPDLLDWVCRDFINNGWSVKKLCRQIVLSATYRQSSALTPALRDKDIDNTLLARGPSHRLSAETIRDAALSSSGLLSKKRGGPPIKPYDPLYNKKPSLDQVHRRSLYSFWRRTTPLANMTIFDKPSLEVCSVKRSRTNSPAQALVLLNDIQFVEAARHLATSLLSQEMDDDARLSTAWNMVTSRKIQDRELALLKEILVEQRAYFTERPESAEKLLKVGLKPAPAKLKPVEAAALTVVCQAIYNTDAAIWKR